LRRTEAVDMVKRRVRAEGLGERGCSHAFPATGITAYLENGRTRERAQQMAAHDSPKTTKLYDRTSDQIRSVRSSEYSFVASPIEQSSHERGFITHNNSSHTPGYFRSHAPGQLSVVGRVIRGGPPQSSL
jgi:hypothetical protein